MAGTECVAARWLARLRPLIEPALVVLTAGALASGGIAWLAGWRDVADGWSNCQYPWIGLFQATSVSVDSTDLVGVMSTGRSSSLPLWNTAPARTSATRCGALTARQRACAASISL